METALENLSKEDLLKVISSRDQTLSERDEKIVYLEAQLSMYKRMQFGQKRERFEGDPNQTMLPTLVPECFRYLRSPRYIKVAGVWPLSRIVFLTAPIIPLRKL